MKKDVNRKILEEQQFPWLTRDHPRELMYKSRYRIAIYHFSSNFLDRLPTVQYVALCNRIVITNSEVVVYWITEVIQNFECYKKIKIRQWK